MKKNTTFIIGMVLSLLLIIIGIVLINVNNNYGKKMVKINASIHQITTTTNNKSIYVDFNSNNKKYTSVVLVDKKVNISMSKGIQIYCNKNKMNECVYNYKNKSGYYLIIIGVLLVLISFIHYRLN